MEAEQVRSRVAIALGLKLGVPNDQARVVGDAVLRVIQDCGLITLLSSDLAKVNHLMAVGIAQNAKLNQALTGLLDHYLQLANSGDFGNWDPETESVVIESRAALADLAAA